MGIYTVSDNEFIDTSVQAKLNLIIDRVLKFLGKSNIKAVILTGSFGKGEGGVILNGKEARLINDLDITVVCKYFKYKKIIESKKSNLEELAQYLAQKVNIKQVDLGISHPARFYLTTNKVSDYEYLNGHKVLYGNINMKKMAKDILPYNLPLEDGTQYFLTRGSGFLLAALYFYNKNKIKHKDRENYLIEINKAVLAMGDSILLIDRKYHFLYQERLKSIDNINFRQAPNGSIIKKLYIDALKWKLKPNMAWQGDKIEINRWFEIRELFRIFFFWYEKSRLKLNMENWEDYLDLIYNKQDEFGIHFIKKIYKKFKTKSKRKDFAAKLSIMPGLLFSLNTDNSIDIQLFNKSINNFSKYYGHTNFKEWDKTAINYLQVFHPGGIVEKITNRQSG